MTNAQAMRVKLEAQRREGQGCALQEADGPRRLAPVETNSTDKIATLREVTGG